MYFHVADAIFWVAVACCAVAQLAILRSVSTSAVAAGGERTPSSRRLGEIVWAVVPGVVLAVVLVFTWRAIHAPAAPAHEGHHVMVSRAP